MDKSLSEQQEMLLYRAAKKNGGTLSVSMAESIYSSKSSARSAIDKMRLFDYIELKTPGYFEIVKMPAGLKQELKAEESDSVDDGGDAVEYEARESKSVEVP
jgi:hypothetical protein